MADVMLRVDGTVLSTTLSYGDVTITDRWPYGPWSLSFGTSLSPRGRRPACLRPGALVEASAMGIPRWVGTLREPDAGAGDYQCDGLARQGEKAAALTSSMGPSLAPGDAIAQARARGLLTWVNRETWPTVAGDTSVLRSVSQLLDASCEARGRRWAIDPYGVVYTGTDPVEPTLFLTAGVTPLGVSTDRQATDLIIGYRSSATIASAVTRYPVAGSGAMTPVERLVDLSGRGLMTEAQAREIGAGILSRLDGGQPVFTSGVEVTRGMLTDRGGHPRPAFRPVHGRRLRALGMYDGRTGASSTEFVVGEATWVVAEDRLSMTPVEYTPRDLASIVEESAGTVAW